MSAEPEDNLLRQLGERERERAPEKAGGQRQREEMWERLAAGELAPEEEAELAERARSSPEEAERLEAFQPLGEDFHQRLMAKLGDQRDRERAPVLTAPSPPVAPPVPRRRRKGWLAGAASAAAAALVGFTLLSPLPVPDFVPNLLKGSQTKRSAEPSGPPVYTSGSEFLLVVQPIDEEVKGALRVRCRIAPRADLHRIVEWLPCAKAKRLANGTLTVAGKVGKDIPFQSGDWTLWIVIERAGLRGYFARPGLPPDEDLVRLRPGEAHRREGQLILRLEEPLRFAML